MRRESRNILVLLVIAALVLLADQTSKHLVVTQLREGQSWDISPRLASIFHITHVTNTGAAFGLFPSFGDFFIVVAVIVIAALILYSLHLPDGLWIIRIALGLQLGGAIGNLIDRLRRGSVVDFIDLNFWPLRRWPVFNLADTSIVAGVTLLALMMVWEEWHEQKGQSIQERQRAIRDG